MGEYEDGPLTLLNGSDAFEEIKGAKHATNWGYNYISSLSTTTRDMKAGSVLFRIF